jgi:hypothetical protein
MPEAMKLPDEAGIFLGTDLSCSFSLPSPSLKLFLGEVNVGK